MIFLLDTNVVSEVRKPRPNPGVLRWFEGADDHELSHSFGDRIAPVTSEVAEEWGRLTALRPLPVIDALLAATALTHDWTLVTRNQRDLATTGVALLNPFE